MLFLLLPPKLDDPPRFLDKDVLIAFGISLPVMIGVLLSEKYQFMKDCHLSTL